MLDASRKRTDEARCRGLGIAGRVQRRDRFEISSLGGEMRLSDEVSPSLLGLLASNAPDRIAIIQPEHNISITYGALEAQVEAVAGVLAALGVRRGDRV